jgi:predicted ABC-type ATPase
MAQRLPTRCNPDDRLNQRVLAGTMIKAEMSILRVAERVTHGGHSIPRADLERRFSRSLRNLFEIYTGAVDYTCCFLNSSETPELIFVQWGKARTVLQTMLFEQLLSEAAK